MTRKNKYVWILVNPILFIISLIVNTGTEHLTSYIGLSGHSPRLWATGNLHLSRFAHPEE